VREAGVFRVELPNRHRLLGYVVRREREMVSHLRVGDRVEVEVSPYDLSKGRVRLEKEKEQ
jgi:translation initiation factor IF-1